VRQFGAHPHDAFLLFLNQHFEVSKKSDFFLDVDNNVKTSILWAI
jgi:hypothetical protein